MEGFIKKQGNGSYSICVWSSRDLKPCAELSIMLTGGKCKIS